MENIMEKGYLRQTKIFIIKVNFLMVTNMEKAS
jgi:hypothetical protein